MKERPIIFTGPMVLAIRAGRKTQTRRLVKLPEFQRSETRGYDWTWRGRAPIRSVAQQVRHPGCWQDVSHERLLGLCPYGQPGDRLWVKETWNFDHTVRGDFRPWGIHDLSGRDMREAMWFQADFHQRYGAWERDVSEKQVHRCEAWRSPIYMPRYLSRELLEVTGVRVERVQSISEEDARAEGMALGIPPECCMDPRAEFHEQWERMHEKRAPWASNPWVWVVDFKRVEAGRVAA